MSEPRRTYRFDGRTFDPGTGDLSGPEETRRLRPQAAKVLELLLRRSGELVTREELQETVWPDTVVEFDQGLNACVKEIRQALDDSATEPRFVETLPRRGYRFLVSAEVEEEVSAGVGGGRDGSSVGEVGERPGALGSRMAALPRVAAWSLLAAALVLVGVVVLPRFVGRADPPGSEARAGEVGAPADDGRERLMVLPVRSPGADLALDTLADVLTDRLIGDLSRLAPARLGVIARTSSMHYEENAPAVATLGDELGLDYVVEGSVVPGAEPSFQVRLVDAADETQLWAGRYPLPAADAGGAAGVAGVADRVSGDVARAVSPSLADAHRNLVASRAGDSEVRDALARVDYLLGLHTMGDTRRALTLVEEVLDDAREHPGLLEALATIHLRLGNTDAAREAAEGALTGQPASAEAHRVLGTLAQRRLAWDTALVHYRRAVELAPGDPVPRNYLAFFYSYLDRGEEAVRHIEAALAVDPVSATIAADAGVVYLWAERYGEAEHHCREALRLRPDMGAALRCLVHAAWLRGRPEDGAPAARRLLELQGAELAEDASGAEVLERYWDRVETEAGGSCAPVTRARVDVVRGRRQEAVEEVESLAPEAASCLLTVAGDPMFAEVRTAPRVVARLEAMGLGGV